MTKLSDKYAPKEPKELLGEIQKRAIQILIRDTPQIVLFTGASGTGKTSTSKLYAAHLLDCSIDELNNNFNFRYVNAKSTKLPFWQNLTDSFNYRILEKTVYLIDEADRLTDHSQIHLNDWFEGNKLPDNVFFILTTLKPDNLNFNKDFKDRLYPRFHFLPPSPNEQKHKMIEVFKSEGVQIDGVYELDNPKKTISKEEANAVFDASNGSIRVLLDNIQSLIDGVFVSPVNAQESPFFTLLLNGEENPVTIFKSLRQYTNYQELCNGIVKSTINSITYKRLSREQEKNGLLMIKLFGNGLSRNAEPKTAFYKLVVDFLDMQ